MSTGSGIPPLPQVQNKLEISPRGGPAGTQVTIKGRYLASNRDAIIGFGTFAEHGFIGEARTNAEGELLATVTVPPTVTTRRGYYFFVAYADQLPRGISDVFRVTGQDGVFSARGRVVGEGSGCALIRGAEGDIYALVGDTSRLRSGTEVVATGTLAETSPCGEGLPVTLRDLQVL